jgi:formate dehydrogenase maturation protein FdhE
MSEKVMRVPVSELTLVRVRCLQCKHDGVIEIPLAQARRAYRDKTCPFCQEYYVAKDETDYLDVLADAVAGLLELQKKKKLAVEFVLPAPPATP